MSEERNLTVKSILIQIVKFGIVIFAIGYLVHSGQLSFSKFRNIDTSNLHYLFIGIGFILCAFFVSFYRYQLLLSGLGIQMGFKDITRICFIGCFFNTFMFGGLGGDVIKLAYVMEETGRRAKAASSVMVDRVLGLLGLITLGGCALLCSWQDVVDNDSLHLLSLAIFGVLGAAGYGTICGFVALAKGRKAGFMLWLSVSIILSIGSYYLLNGKSLAFGLNLSVSNPELLRGRAVITMLIDAFFGLLCVAVLPSCQPGRKLEVIIRLQLPGGKMLMKLINAVLAYRNNFLSVCKAYILSVILQGMALASICLFSMLLVKTEISHVLFAAPPAFVANALPLPLGSLGVGESALGGFLKMASQGQVKDGAVIFLFYRFWSIMIGLIGLPLYLIGKKEIKDVTNKYEEEIKEEKADTNIKK